MLMIDVPRAKCGAGRFCLAGILLAATLVPAAQLEAGGGPHNLMLVVNAQSVASQSIANEYIALRQVPAQNVIYLDSVPDKEVINLGEFRQRILKPVLEAIAERRLADHIDYIVYSADFPTAIKLGEEAESFLQAAGANRQAFQPTASINALTYFSDAVVQQNPAFMGLSSNWYMRLPVKEMFVSPLVGPPQEKYQSALAKIRGEKFQEAVDLLEPLQKEHPQQFAISYTLARAQAQAGHTEQALLSLLQATGAGWSFRRQTLAEPAFAGLLNQRSFQRVVEQIPDLPYELAPAMGFQRSYSWGPNGLRNGTPPTGNRFFLSTVLAVTRNRGTTEAQALYALRNSVAADGSRPQGTVYLSKTSNVRSRTRADQFQSTVDALRRFGVAAQIVTTDLPVRQLGVAGATIGSGGFDWGASGSRILPGAICENLTSFGGNMRPNAKQTPLSEFIKHGAAGSSGTVCEPLAIAAKFPHPWIHVFYASGCSLAEAYYQSVHGPFQLLIVGDALCQPWAVFPQFSIDGVRPGATVSGRLRMETKVKSESVPIRHLELYLDGRKASRNFAPDEPIELDTATITDGWHELRVVAVSAGLIETQSSWVGPVWVDNQGHKVKLSTTGSHQVKLGQPVKLAVEADGQGVEVMQNSRTVARIAGRRGEIELSSDELGRGLTKLMARYRHEGGWVYSEPVEVDIRY